MKTKTEAELLSWPECARLCKSVSVQPHTSVAFVWGQNDHVLRGFFHTTALPHLRRLRIENPTWQCGPGDLFIGLAERGRPLEEMIVTTSLDHARKRCVRFTVRFGDDGEPITEYEIPREPLLEGELDEAMMGLGLPRPTIKAQVLRHLAHLVGQKLSIARRAADLRGFHFGLVTPLPDGGDSGQLVLHLQCPWRIDGPRGIVTGRSDLWEPADPREELDFDAWDYEQGNLQDRRIGELLGTYAPGKRSYANESDGLVVEAVDADDFGGVVLSLSDGLRLVVFPSGSAGEDWRLFRPSSPGHVVVSGGKIDESLHASVLSGD